MKKFYNSILFLFLSFSLLAQIPNGYYNNAEGKTGYSLKTALHNIIKNGHQARDYGELYSAYEIGDNDPEDGYVWDMYSENPNDTDPYNFVHYDNKCGNYSSEGDCYNREHLFPQGVFSSASPMKTDYHHVVPSDGKVNGMRSNYPFGEVGSANWTSMNGSKKGNSASPGYSGTVFEPIDEYKGDIARCMLYFATRYEDKVSSWSHDMINGTSDQVYTEWFLDLLLKWHEQDPVSQKEVVRNNTGYNFQGNRNPFIDHPEYVCKIWSSDCDETSIYEITHNHFSIYPNPAKNNITIKTENILIKKIQLYNLNSQLLVTNNFDDTNVSINISEQNSGIFILKIHTSEEIYTSKIVVE